MNPVLEKKLENCQTLPSLPVIAHRVIELSRSDSASSAQIADILEKDPTLAAKVVALANSAANMSARSIDSVQDAITRIGLDMTMTLALSFSFARAMYDKQVNTMDHDVFWRRSLLSGALAKVLAEHLKLEKPDRFFLAGLVQDIGMLALNEVESERYGVLFHSAGTHRDLFRFETAEFSCDHAEVGAWLLKHWGMPEFYVDLVAHSHDRAKPETPAEYLAIIFASQFAELWVQQDRTAVMNRLIQMGSESKLLRSRDINQIVDTVSERLPDLNAIFETRIETAFVSASLIEEAKQQLVVRNMQLMQDLAQARSDAAQARASEEELKDRLKKDQLTGVFNRGYIESICTKAFRQATDKQRPLTVMFLDIDHFKQVNDGYGHQVGDLALKHFARILLRASGRSYWVGRYGGEEFVIIMPGATTDIGLTVAGRIRELLCQYPIRVSDSLRLPVRTSIGIATYTPGQVSSGQKNFQCAESLLDAADKTMYRAKQSGRDRALVFSA